MIGLRLELKRAIKDHDCTVCDHTIPTGSIYAWQYPYRNDAYYQKMHLRCARKRIALEIGVHKGQIKKYKKMDRKLKGVVRAYKKVLALEV